MEQTELLVPFQDVEVEMIEKKSRFIGNIFLVSSEEEALARRDEVHSRHPTASHGVYAYDIKADNITRFSDAGEPKGTAGMPVLDVFRKRGLTNYICIVTRYFGGILLGAGGLVRAYSGTAALALEAAGVARMAPFTTLEVLCEYPYYEKLRSMLKAYPIRQEETSFDLDVTYRIQMPADAVEAVTGAVTECTSGRAIISVADECFLPVRL
ncbi:MAG: DUF1949 domain-containing protein [Ruminococcaceae bacterium]|nr:DUF1949 domain-containing protein [Oscillospiraceae bacterium]